MNNLQTLFGKNLAISLRYGKHLIDIINGSAIEKEVKSFSGLSLPEGIKYSEKIDNIGILNIRGLIIPFVSWLEDYIDVVSIENLTREFDLLQSDKTIEKIILKMDTPGGYVTEISEFAEKIKRSNKEVIAHVIGDAASGGYFIASQAKKITSVNTGVVGSIGVVATIIDSSEYEEKNGIKTIEIISSQTPRKRTDMTTPEGQTEIQAILNDMADVFISTVAQGRKTDIENVINNFGQGGEVSATEALKRGMIDEIINTMDLIESIKIKKSSMTLKIQETKGVKKMSDQNETMPNLDLLKKETMAKERDRIRAIEAIAKDFEGDDPKVVEAVKKVIDEEKFKDDSTVEKVKSIAAKAAYEKGKELLAIAKQPREKLAEQLR